MGSTIGGLGMPSVAKKGAGHQMRHAWTMAQNEFWAQREGIMKDPFLKQSLQGSLAQAKMPWMQVGKTMGRQQADLQTRALQDALAARGGGNLASALSMGSQARVGAGMQGLQAGFGMKQQALGTLSAAAQGRLQLLNQLYGAFTGVSTGAMGAGAQLGGAAAGAASNMWASLFGAAKQEDQN